MTADAAVPQRRPPGAPALFAPRLLGAFPKRGSAARQIVAGGLVPACKRFWTNINTNTPFANPSQDLLWRFLSHGPEVYAPRAHRVQSRSSHATRGIEKARMLETRRAISAARLAVGSILTV